MHVSLNSYLRTLGFKCLHTYAKLVYFRHGGRQIISVRITHEDDNDTSLLDGSFLEVSKEEEVLANMFKCRVCGKTYKYVL